MTSKVLSCMLMAVALGQGCGQPAVMTTRDVRIAGAHSGDQPKAAMNQVEMQQAVERFTGTFLDTIINAMGPLTTSSRLELRREALKRMLVYSSSALDIATGPYPEVNALDMVVFVRLSRGAIDRHWVPQVFGDEGRPLANAFLESEERAWNLVSKVLGQGQRRELAHVIDAWESENPGQIRVEMVRFEEFSVRAGKVASDYQKQAAGLLGSLKTAAMAADEALLLAERGMFLAHRLPTLMRLQARLGAQEVMGDSVEQFHQLEEDITRVTGGGRAIEDLSTLTRSSLATAQEARRTLEDLKPILELLPPHEELSQTLASTNQLADKGLALLREVRALAPHDAKEAVAIVEAGADRMMRRAVTYLAVLGAAWAVVFWGGYYVVRRSTRRGRVLTS